MSDVFLKLENYQVNAAITVKVEHCVAKVHSWIHVDAPSGFGKTTLIRGLAGLEPQVGGLELEGRTLTHLQARDRQMGVVFQDHLLFPSMTALENVYYGRWVRGQLGFRREKKNALIQEAKHLMDLLGLKDRYDAPIQGLSGGERQRIAILRATYWKPKLLILDEPFKGLDDQIKLKTFDYLKDFAANEQVCVICVSHPTDFKMNAEVRLQGITSGEPSHVRKFVADRP